MDSKPRKIDKYLGDAQQSGGQDHAFLNDVLKSSKDVLYRYNLKTKTYDYVSDSIESFSGYTPEEIYAAGTKILMSTLHPDDKDAFIQVFSTILDSTVTDSDIILEYRTQHKDGRYIWRRDHKKIIRDENGRVSAAVGVLTNICDLIESQEELKASEERYKRLSEAAFEAIAIHKDGTILEVNQQYLDMFGYTWKEAKKVSGIEMIAPQSRQLVQEHIASGYQGDYEAFGLKKDGAIFPILIRAKISEHDGQSVRIGAIWDLTEQKKLEEKNRESEQLYRTLFEGIDAGLSVIDKEGRFLLGNKTARSHCGLSHEQLLNSTLYDIYPKDAADSYLSRIQGIIENGEREVITEKAPIDGQERWLQVAFFPLKDKDGNYDRVLVVALDIHEQIQLKDKIKAKDELYRTVVQNANEAIMFIDSDGDYLFMNDFALQKNELTLDQVVGKNLTDLFPKEYAHLITSETKTVLTSNEVSLSRHIVPLKPQPRWNEVIIIPLKDVLGQSECVLLMAHDIHEEMLLKEKITESEQKYRELYKNAQAALFRTRISDSKLLDFSRVTAMLLGYADDDEFLNLISVSETYVDPQQRDQLLEALRKNKRVQDFQTQLKRKDGTHFWASISAEIFPELDYLEGVIVDISIAKCLSKAEKKILDYLMQGKSNKEIAKALKRSVRTVEDHRSNIMRKLGVDNIVDLTRKALESRVFPYEK